MTTAQAHNLGNYLRSARERAGVSARSLGRSTHVEDTTILRIERGEITSPRADLLGDIAEVLHLPIADIYLLAGYPIAPELPGLDLYLAAKYPDLPARDRQAILRTAERSKCGDTEAAS